MSEEAKQPAEAPVFPEDIQVIRTVETLKVVADPLRLRLLAALRRSPASAKELAKLLDTPLKGLYYHLGLLEEHGLIRVRSTRIVSGIIEKQFEPTAYRLTVDRALFAPEAPAAAQGLEVFVSIVLDHAHAEIQRSMALGLIDTDAPDLEAGGITLGRLWLRLKPEQRAALDRQIKAAWLSYAEQQATPDDPEARYYEYLSGSYPVIAPPLDGKEPQL
jgi:DNA-binding transcriptional ArsR family regulator